MAWRCLSQEGRRTAEPPASAEGARGQKPKRSSRQNSLDRRSKGSTGFKPERQGAFAPNNSALALTFD